MAEDYTVARSSSRLKHDISSVSELCSLIFKVFNH